MLIVLSLAQLVEDADVRPDHPSSSPSVEANMGAYFFLIKKPLQGQPSFF